LNTFGSNFKLSYYIYSETLLKLTSLWLSSSKTTCSPTAIKSSYPSLISNIS
jgi:hypothetical protein